MPAARPMDELREKAAALIIDRIKSVERPITVAAAALKLKISRQAVYDILRGKYCPSLSLVQRACEVFELEFDFRGMLIKPEVFERNYSSPSEPSVQSEIIFEALPQLSARNFEIIAAKPMGRALEITLRLTIPSGKVGAA